MAAIVATLSEHETIEIDIDLKVPAVASPVTEAVASVEQSMLNLTVDSFSPSSRSVWSNVY